MNANPTVTLQIIELDPELGSYSVKEGLTEDAVSARLHKGNQACPNCTERLVAIHW